MVTDRLDARSDAWNGDHLDALLESLDLTGAVLLAVGWSDGMRDFEIGLADGRFLLFEDCLQISFHRPPGSGEPPLFGGWWIDEPSPVLTSLGPEIALQYRHLVFELGDGLLRVACRRVRAGRDERPATTDSSEYGVRKADRQLTAPNTDSARRTDG
jgi:hypothetical protein